MLEIASQMIVCLLLAALLGFIIGYLLCKATCNDDLGCDSEETHDTHSESQHTTEVSGEPDESSAMDPGIAPQRLDEPRNGQKDNLSRIKGIGVKIEETLNDEGIYHFDQIANWDEENVKWIDTNVGFPGRIKREKWIEQAEALAAGEETEFSKRVGAGEVSTSKKSQ